MLDPLNLPDRKEPKESKLEEAFQDYWGNMTPSNTLALFVRFVGNSEVTSFLSEKSLEDFESYVYESFRKGR